MKENDKIKKASVSLPEEEIEKVAGGSGPEEFDWRDKNPAGLIGDPTDSLWSFSAEGNVEGQYFKKITKGPVHISGGHGSGQTK